MAIKANIDLSKAKEIIDRRYHHQNCWLGDTVIVHPDEDPLNKMILSRHCMDVRENDKVVKGGAFMMNVPQWLLNAVIEWEDSRG